MLWDTLLSAVERVKEWPWQRPRDSQREDGSIRGISKNSLSRFMALYFRNIHAILSAWVYKFRPLSFNALNVLCSRAILPMYNHFVGANAGP